ncbi:flagellar FliJ family protein [Buchnera aphidicola (Pemphigus obesinymphae)]|nr:flagellar FliJ family protein [Buchnera aphidicola (Pemphigus obesinymphae)]
MEQCDLLRKYRYDYNNQLNNYVKVGVTGVKWENYIKFIKMLEIGIKEQNKEITEYDNDLKNCFSNWCYVNSKLKGWEILDLKIVLKELKKTIELEEMNIDELYKLKFLKNRGIKL